MLSGWVRSRRSSLAAEKAGVGGWWVSVVLLSCGLLCDMISVLYLNGGG